MQHAAVEWGIGVAMLGDDMHTVHIEGAAPNFRCDGLTPERLTRGRFWHAHSSQWRVCNDIGLIVEARPDSS